MDGLREYAGAVSADVKAAVKLTARETAGELRKTSPKATGRYAKGWKMRTSFENGTSARCTVFNATDYQLTHLLEKGHAKRGGGRVAAIPHIAPAEEKAAQALVKRVKEAVR